MLRLAVAAALVSLPGAASAAPRWTFCLAAAGGGAEIWISDVLQADGGREQVAAAFKGAVDKLGATGLEARCPGPREDRTVALAARSDVEAFNRAIGATIHAVPTSDLVGPAAQGPKGARLPTGYGARAEAPAGRSSDTRSIAGDGPPDQTKR